MYLTEANVCVFVIWLLLLPLVIVVVVVAVVQMNRTCKTMEKKQQDKDREINSSELYLTNISLLNAYEMGKIGNTACKKKTQHTKRKMRVYISLKMYRATYHRGA